jgi:hypothetical protein
MKRMAMASVSSDARCYQIATHPFRLKTPCGMIEKDSLWWAITSKLAPTNRRSLGLPREKNMILTYFVKSSCSAFRERQIVEAIFSRAVYQGRPIERRRSKIRSHDLVVSVSTTEQERIFLASACGYGGPCTTHFSHDTKSVWELYALFIHPYTSSKLEQESKYLRKCSRLRNRNYRIFSGVTRTWSRQPKSFSTDAARHY